MQTMLLGFEGGGFWVLGLGFWGFRGLLDVRTTVGHTWNWPCKRGPELRPQYTTVLIVRTLNKVGVAQSPKS